MLGQHVVPLALRRRVCGFISCKYSTTVGKTVVTAVEKGLEYEDQVARVMALYNCRLTPTSMSVDGGVDHYGVWALPDNDVQIVTQCKHEQSPTGVSYLREFEGVLSSQPNSVVGVFASASGYSVFAKRFFSRMQNPAIRMTIVHDTMVEFDMNPVARLRLPRLVPGTAFTNNVPNVVLMYDGCVLRAPPFTHG
ncbi:hypothetical protein H257_12628 [Aphanomyces astaci]|uniref:Restriction endonuclease type IV Mrr domain-containing protein n=1 Tax=Aphanomyces astaci TaxID=112090 RepID=W4G0S7_APHAT|nr:hypothetical protein H257_12628 [Aphanomyces astaci]ETV72538.1 hypothetical protein H257_12628 [Aphanomyces astaci]|eukprot:XP_009838220.1 hypothetical protein H257_12628 [Aphanomyces astaci]